MYRTNDGEQVHMILTNEEAIALGRKVVQEGQLLSLRERLGISPSAMAEMLQTPRPMYKKWEAGLVRLQKQTAERVGRFFDNATTELSVMDEHGMDIRNMVPFHVVATLLGIPQEQLLYRYRNGEFEAQDLGILGLWVYQSDLDELRA